MKFAGLVTTTYPLADPRNNPHLVPQLWGQLMQRMGELELAATGPMFGVGRMVGEEMEYLAGFEADTAFDGGVLWDVPAAEYAVFDHVGSLATLCHTFDFIFSEWLPASGRQMAAAPLLEIYDERFDDSNPESVFEICLPLA